MAVARNGSRNDSVETHPFYVAAEEWLKDPEAKSLATRLAQRSGFNINPDDLRADALRKVWSRLRNNPTGLEDANVAAYCTQSMKNTLSTVAQGHAKDDSFDDGPAMDHRSVLADDEAVAWVSSSGAFSHDLRAAIEVDTSLPTWVASAALNAITLTMHPEIDLTGAPTPQAGSAPSTALMWPSMWFAGKRDRLFPDGDGDDAAQRQRRNRAIQEVRSAIEAARMRVEVGAASHG